jgi:CrcB protein
MWISFLVAVGGALGSVARYWAALLIDNNSRGLLPWGQTFPWGTLLVNITGCFVIGFFATLTQPEGRFQAGSDARLFFMTGICGGYTTFSSFSLQTLNLVRDGDWLKAGANVALSVALCMIAVWLGYFLAMVLNTIKGR